MSKYKYTIFNLSNYFTLIKDVFTSYSKPRHFMIIINTRKNLKCNKQYVTR